MLISCDHGSGRRPKNQKTTKWSCTILHDSTNPAIWRFWQPSPGSMNSAASMICIVLKDLGIGITMPLREFENSVWFGTYEFLKFDQIASHMFPSIFFSSFFIQRFSSPDFFTSSNCRSLLKFGMHIPSTFVYMTF